MPAWGPVKRRDLIRHLRQLGFDGPHPGGNHQYLQRGPLKLRIPNEHRDDIGIDLLRRILEQAGIDRETWELL